MKSIKKRHLAGALVLFLLGQSCAEIIEKDLSKKQVPLTAPSDKVTLPDSTATLTFAWEAVDGALKYKLQLVSPAFDSIAQVWADTTVTLTDFPLTLATPLTSGRYQWRVMALNNTSASNYSDIRNFIIK